jgi:hypothetical protein
VFGHGQHVAEVSKVHRVARDLIIDNVYRIG